MNSNKWWWIIFFHWVWTYCIYVMIRNVFIFPRTKHFQKCKKDSRNLNFKNPIFSSVSMIWDLSCGVSDNALEFQISCYWLSLSSLLRHTRVRDMCWLKSPACQDATSLRLHLIDFSPLCLLNCLLKSPARRPSLLRDTRVVDKCWLPVPLTTKCHITNCWASKPAYTQVRSQPPLSPLPPCLLPPAQLAHVWLPSPREFTMQFISSGRAGSPNIVSCAVSSIAF